MTDMNRPIYLLRFVQTAEISGGGSETIVVETLVFDATQVTSKANGNNPTWGDCHTISAGNANRATVIIREKNDEDKDGTGIYCTERATDGRYGVADADCPCGNRGGAAADPRFGDRR